MPNSALGLTYNSYKSDPTLTANMQIWLKDRAVDQVFNGVALFRYLTGRDQKEMSLDQIKASGALDLRDGGQSIDVPLLTAANSTVQSYHNYQTVATTPQAGIGPAFVNWREYAATVTISKYEELTNMDTKSRVIKLLQTKQMQTEKSLIDRFNKDLWKGDQSQASLAKSFSTDVDGIPYWIEEDPTTSTNVGAIDRSAESFWRNQFNGTSQVVTATNPSFSAEGKNDIQLYVMESSGGIGFDEIDCLFTTKTIYNYLWDSLEDMRRYTSSESGDAGFRRLAFQGIPVKWDDALSARQNVYGLNSKYLNMVVHRDAFMSTEGFQKPTNQTAKTSIIMMMWNLVCTNPRRQFVLSNWAA